MQELTGIKCVAFDFYGTMFISGAGDIGVDEKQKTAHKRHLKKALKEAGFSADHPSLAEKGLSEFRRIIEQHTKQKQEEDIDYPEPNILTIWQKALTALAKLNLIEGPVTEDQAICVALGFEYRTNTVWPVPGLREVLTELLDRQMTLGIISNSQFYTPLTFEALIGETTGDFGFDKDLQKWSYKEGIKKPSLRFYRTFTDELPAKNLAPGEVLFVGNDLFKDIVPAKNSGMKTALFVGDHRSLRHENEDLTYPDHQPDIIIDDLHQIVECLG
jgi:putative hydrolase of the HAD superfamily